MTKNKITNSIITLSMFHFGTCFKGIDGLNLSCQIFSDNCPDFSDKSFLNKSNSTYLN
jgi:hypothetical protein